jgi:hypothetical protein
MLFRLIDVIKLTGTRCEQYTGPDRRPVVPRGKKETPRRAVTCSQPTWTTKQVRPGRLAEDPLASFLPTRSDWSATSPPASHHPPKRPASLLSSTPGSLCLALPVSVSPVHHLDQYHLPLGGPLVQPQRKGTGETPRETRNEGIPARPTILRVSARVCTDTEPSSWR